MTTTIAPTTTTAAAHALTVNADALTRVLRITAHGLLKGTRGGLPAQPRGAVRVEPPGTADGNRVDLDAPVGLNPAFLADALDSFPGTVTLAGTNPATRPWTFTDDGPARVLLMPVKLTAPEEPAGTPAPAPAD